MGYFEGKRGLRQGDPSSHFLFVLAMELLSVLLQEATVSMKLFKFHPRCPDLQLTHLCFADDLLIFPSADLKTLVAIKSDEFARLLGLSANPSKSTVYCSGIPPALKQLVLDCLQVKEGTLPIQYLGH